MKENISRFFYLVYDFIVPLIVLSACLFLHLKGLKFMFVSKTLSFVEACLLLKLCNVSLLNMI